jgi:nicotinamide-nucleotide amidase
MSKEIQILAKVLGQYLKKHDRYLATAESCTGGGLAYAITMIPGSSVWFDRGFTTYGNRSKQTILDIPKQLLETHGAVSQETVILMAQNTLEKSMADIALSITGIAGPEGGTPQKPVGTVYFGIAQKSMLAQARKQFFTGDRENIRQQSIQFCLRWAMQTLQNNPT